MRPGIKVMRQSTGEITGSSFRVCHNSKTRVIANPEGVKQSRFEIAASPAAPRNDGLVIPPPFIDRLRSFSRKAQVMLETVFALAMLVLFLLGAMAILRSANQ